MQHIKEAEHLVFRGTAWGYFDTAASNSFG